ncbi:hypothetical protein SUGI_0109080 [Cryptomeria japonica]|nr:hypothetical protein SUGI_0109080 [Cryptomeria japonica]
MKEDNEEVVCACKRVREERHENEKPEQQKKPRVDSSKVEYPDLEEDFIDNIDEGRVYNLMRELMEEIGVIADHPLPPPSPLTLPVQSTPVVPYVSCDSALSSTNCSSKCSDPHNYSVSIEVDSAKREVDRVVEDYCPQEDYYQQEDFPEVFGVDDVMISDSAAWTMFNPCSLDTEYAIWQAFDHVSPGRTFKAKEI